MSSGSAYVPDADLEGGVDLVEAGAAKHIEIDLASLGLLHLGGHLEDILRVEHLAAALALLLEEQPHLVGNEGLLFLQVEEAPLAVVLGNLLVVLLPSVKQRVH